MNKLFTLLAAAIAIPCTAWAGYPSPQLQKAIEAYNQEHYESALQQFTAIVTQQPAEPAPAPVPVPAPEPVPEAESEPAPGAEDVLIGAE